MVDLSYSQSVYSLLPPVMAIVMAIITRRVILSLGLGIIFGVLLISAFSFEHSVALLSEKVTALFWVDQSPNAWNLYILGFLFLLGAITTLVSASGSSRAFAEWARHRIKTRREAEFLTITLGIIIFIDDYFNSLVVGSVSQPITDRYNISRAKLAYLLDSTASPVCVLMPLSSWGAYIAALIGGLLIADGREGISSIRMLVELIPYNFYALFSLGLLCAVAFWHLDVGPMYTEQKRAERGELFDAEKGAPAGINESHQELRHGHIWGLFLPVISLVVATLFFMIVTGIYALNGSGVPLSTMSVLEHLDLGFSLFYGALVSVFFALVVSFSHRLSMKELGVSFGQGVWSMLPAVMVLLFAWVMASVINDLGAGKYVAGLAMDNIPTLLLPMLLFLLTGFIAFSTGTSWGTFGIMIPIAINMTSGSDVAAMYPLLAAVLSGAVFGDHCSPISDTTILSSTGAGCHHMDHVVTQLPYALIAAGIAALGFLCLGVTHSLVLSLCVCFGFFVVAIMGIKKIISSRAVSAL